MLMQIMFKNLSAALIWIKAARFGGNYYVGRIKHDGEEITSARDTLAALPLLAFAGVIDARSSSGFRGESSA
jgi:hypothetical protein